MRLDQANRLLEREPLELETGVVRLEDGALHVAVLTPLRGVEGRMVDWRFGFLETTEQYKWWHPRDHVWCEWVGERGTGRYVNGTHRVHEYIGGELQKLKIHFRDPAKVLDISRFEGAGVTSVQYARVGPLEGEGWIGHLIHVCRDTDYGTEMRSRFWLGDIEPLAKPLPPESVAALTPEALGRALLRHCSEEMTYLGGFLPGLYRKHNGDPGAAPRG
jgi:hypothetical protein